MRIAHSALMASNDLPVKLDSSLAAIGGQLWNERSLDYANAVADDRVRGFYRSLYLNMGKIHEILGNREDAKRFYEITARALESLPAIVGAAVEKALLRLLQ